jgi:hypothetical protein
MLTQRQKTACVPDEMLNRPQHAAFDPRFLVFDIENLDGSFPSQECVQLRSLVSHERDLFSTRAPGQCPDLLSILEQGCDLLVIDGYHPQPVELPIFSVHFSIVLGFVFVLFVLRSLVRTKESNRFPIGAPILLSNTLLILCRSQR